MADDIHYTSRSDHKRKYEDPSPTTISPPPRRQTGFSAPIVPDADGDGGPAYYNAVQPPVDGIQLAKQRAQEIAARLFSDAEAKRPKVENGGGGDDSSDKGFSSIVADHASKPLSHQMSSLTSQSSFPAYGYPGSNKKIEIPNGRVGVIIGKGGETIKYLQLQSGAKIQVTRDMDADPNSQTRMVELIGTSEQISKAEQLISDVLAEAEAGGSGIISSRKVGSVQSHLGAEQFSMKIPNNKVGLIIGKGGENIKSMQSKSGARIQVVPLHLPPGDHSTERTLYIDGTQEQIESAKLLVNEVISENRVRNPNAGGGYPSQGYRPPHPPTWGPPGAPPMQQPGYGYMQSGAYPGAPPPYNTSQQAYGAYPPPASGWDQTTNQQTQSAAPGSGYDYYNQQQPPSQQHTVGGSASDGTSYNYGQPPSSYTSQGSYGDSTYPQTTGQQQDYGYASAPQPGYSQPLPNPSGYDQQGYGSAPGYGTITNPTQDGPAPYGAQSGATQTPPTQSVPGQQSSSQQGYTNQPPVTSSAGYTTQGSAPAGYASSQYGNPPSQSVYGQPAPPTQPNYGQPPQAQKPPQAVYGQGQQPVAPQSGYMQPAPSPTGYGQVPQPQSGYTQDSTHHPPSSYGQQSYGVPPPNQSGYSQQQQSYADSYGSGAYSQTSTYSGDNAAHASYKTSATAPTAPAGTTKASPS